MPHRVLILDSVGPFMDKLVHCARTYCTTNHNHIVLGQGTGLSEIYRFEALNRPQKLVENNYTNPNYYYMNLYNLNNFGPKRKLH